MNFILNATPLIYLTKAGLSWIFKAVKGVVFSTPAVYSEIVRRGKELGCPDAKVIEDLFERGILAVRTPKRTILRRIRETATESVGAPLHAGEAEVLALAEELGAVAIVDEKPAREVGETLGIEVRGSAYLIGLTVKARKIKVGQAIQAIDKMISGGWRISIEDYLKIVAELKRR